MKSFFSVIMLSVFILAVPSANAGDNSELEALKQEIENLKKDSYLADTIRENELLKMSLKKLKSEVGELAVLNEEIAGLKKKLAQAEESFSKEKAVSMELSQAIVAERKTQYDLKKELEKTQAERNVIQDQLADVTRDKKQRDEKLAEFQKQIQDARAEQEAMKTQLKDISLENQNLKSNLDSLSKAQDNLKLSLGEAGKNSEKFLKDIDTLKSENTALKTEKENMAKIKQGQDQKINVLNTLAADKEQKLQEKEALCQKLDQDFKKAKSDNAELLAAIEKTKKEKEKTEAEYASYEQKIAYLTEKLTELDKENEKKTEELEKVKGALNRTMDIFKGLEIK